MNDQELIKHLKLALPKMTTPTRLARKLAALPGRNFHDEALNPPLPPLRHWGLRPYLATSLLLHAAAGLAIVILLTKLYATPNVDVVVKITPTVSAPLSPFLSAALATRAERPAILVHGERLANGDVAVKIAQFTDNTQLTLVVDDELGCVRAYFPSTTITGGVSVAVQHAQLTIPQKLTATFADDLRLWIIEMDNYLEIWSVGRYQELAQSRENNANINGKHCA